MKSKVEIELLESILGEIEMELYTLGLGVALVVFASFLMMNVTKERALIIEKGGVLLAILMTTISYVGIWKQQTSPANIPWLAWWYGINSIMTVFIYGYDKRGANPEVWRISEISLHTLELLGGWPGAFIGSRRYDHKTNWSREWKFKSIRLFIVLIHGLGWIWWYTGWPLK